MDHGLSARRRKVAVVAKPRNAKPAKWIAFCHIPGSFR